MEHGHAAPAVRKRVLSEFSVAKVQTRYSSFPPLPATLPRQIPPVPRIVLRVHHITPVTPSDHQSTLIVPHCLKPHSSLLRTFHWLLDTLVAIARFLNCASQVLPTTDGFSFHFTLYRLFPLLPCSPARVPRLSVMCSRQTGSHIPFHFVPLSVRSTITPSFFST